MENVNGFQTWIAEREMEDNFTLLNLQDKENFKKDMSELEIMGIKRVIEILEYEGLETETGEYAYTSSGAYAAYNYLGAEFTLDEETGEHISHFGVLHNGVLVLVTWDDNENEKHYRVDWEG